MTRTDKVQQNKNQKRKTIFRCVCLCLCVITFSTKKNEKNLAEDANGNNKDVCACGKYESRGKRGWSSRSKKVIEW